MVVVTRVVVVVVEVVMVVGLRRLTVLPLSFFLSLGTRRSQPQPARRPPGVWKRWKPSPSPTLVTLPKRLRRR